MTAVAFPCEQGACEFFVADDPYDCHTKLGYFQKTNAVGLLETTLCPREAALLTIPEIDNTDRHPKMTAILQSWGVVLPEEIQNA